MARYNADTLYNLLPAIYRYRDQREQAGALRALLAVLAGQAELVEDDIARLYDNWFIETCEPWVAAYIGELLGVRPLHSVTAQTIDTRAQVANTIAYRRRKGAATMLEQLAHDTTGWNARVVEFFQLLATNQNLNHQRPANVRTPDLRDGSALELCGTPFDAIPRTADVRPISRGRGRHNIPNVGIFLWRLQAFHLVQATAFAHGGGRFSFNPLGLDAPLFNSPQPETEITHLAEEINVPGPLRPSALREQKAQYFGTQPVFQIFEGDSPEAIAPEQIAIADLSKWPEPPPGASVAVDPVLGRFVLADTAAQRARASYSYGFSAPLGGGPYTRALPPAPGGPNASRGDIIRVPSDAAPTLADAVVLWTKAGKPHQVIQIDNNRTHQAGLTIELAGTELVIQAAQGARPVLTGNLVIEGGGDTAALTLDGIVLDGVLHLRGRLRKLRLSHATLVPRETASPVVDPPNDSLEIEIDHCILGGVVLPETADSLSAADSIIDPPHRSAQPVLISGALSPFPALTSPSLQFCIVIGSEGPYRIGFPAKPSTLSQARDQVQSAIRAASASAAFSQAHVITVADRLVIIPGAPAPVVVEVAPDDATAAELRLIPTLARQGHALTGDRLPATIDLDRSAPEIEIAKARDTTRTFSLERGKTTPAKVREKLDQFLSAAYRAGGLHVWAGQLADRLVLIWDASGIPFRFGGTRKDYRTVRLLGLQSDWPAIAADDTGERPAPRARIERCTILGPVHVRELELAADTIFAHQLHVDRRQFGCVRFSYLAPGSHAPHAYDSHSAGVWPSFTDQRYGQPGYAQLSAACSAEIRTGAGNGAEMGAFNELLQPQREANLLGSLDEYLRFGLEAGIFFVN